MKPDTRFETQYGHPLSYVVGIDEVGRGPLAGPVVAGALVLPLEDRLFDRKSYPWISDIADSKCVTHEKRLELAPFIEEWSPAWGIGVATVEEIDQINIYHAAHLAMKRALAQVTERLATRGLTAVHALVDGNAIPKGVELPATAIVKGDMKCLSIAAASILAKVWRDREMQKLDAIHPGYEFAAHKGYPTPVHLARLRELGPCAIHRRSFAPVAKCLEAASPDSF